MQPKMYEIGLSKDSVVVPQGFVTDMTSIPPVLQSIIQQNGPYQPPAIVHDLYWRQQCTREQSDRILLLKDRVDMNPASRPGPDRTDRPERRF